jgi:hypothetical protein
MRTHLSLVAAVVSTLALAAVVPARSQAPTTAADVLARAVAAHGGDRLSSWQTMTITGTIAMEDGITYRAAYRVLAKMPDRLKVEQDMTVDRGGRYVYEYFRNAGQAWSRRNLIVGKADPARLDRWWNQCFGPAYYAKQATALALKPEATSDWTPPSGGKTDLPAAERRPAHVVSATTPTGTVELYIDKKTFYVLEESTAAGRRVYAVFRTFAGTVHPTRILEITRGRNGEVMTPITYESVQYGERIDDWVFEEDMPRKGSGGEASMHEFGNVFVPSGLRAE